MIPEISPLETSDLREISGGGIFREAGKWFGENVICPIACSIAAWVTHGYDMGKSKVIE